jgi:hypothetical protein
MFTRYEPFNTLASKAAKNKALCEVPNCRSLHKMLWIQSYQKVSYDSVK